MKRVLVLALSTFWSTPVLAQTVVPSDVGVAQRSRPDYDPIGGRVGTFVLYPSLLVSTDYNDNLYATETNKVDDAELVLRPSVRLASDWVRHRLEVSGYYQRSFHATRTTENNSQAQMRLNGALDISRRSNLDVSMSIGRLTEARTDINSTSAARSPVTLDSFDSRLTYRQLFNRMSVVATGGVSRFDYNNVFAFDGTLLDQSFRNGKLVDGGVTVGYEFANGLSVIGRVQADRLSYDRKTINTGSGLIPFDRDSTGSRLEAGVSLDFTRLLSGTIRAGVLRRDNDNPLFLDANGVSFGADLLYNVTPLTSVRLIADRTIEPGGSPLTSGNLRAQGTLMVDHELRRWLILSASLRYARLDPQGGNFEGSNEVEGALSARYLLNRRWQARAEYRYFSRSEGVFQPFTTNVLLAQLQFSL